MAKFLVTGATGFLGNAVARTLLNQGHEVRITCRRNSDQRTLDGLDLERVTADLCDIHSFKDLAVGCDALFHVAADYRLWVPNPASMYKANVDGTEALIIAALEQGVSRVVYTSSVATLNVTADAQQSDEQDIGSLQHMIGHYKRSKFLGEQRVRALIAQEDAPIVIVSPTAPVGPRDIKPTPTGKIIVDAANGKMPAYLDTGLNIAHVDDVALGHWKAYLKGTPGENYILGSEDLLLKDILAMVAEFMGRKAPSIQISPGVVLPIAYLCEAWAKLTGKEPAVPLDGVRMAAKKMFFSHAKAQAQLGYHPRPAREAVGDALNWFFQQGYVRQAPAVHTIANARSTK